MALLNVLPIGLGNFGGQAVNSIIGGLNEKVKGIAINASKKDLSLLRQDIKTYPIGDYNGTGKDRVLGSEYMDKHAKGLLSDMTFSRLVDEADVICLIAASGGGFGSGSLPVLAKYILDRNPDKCVVCMTTLPSISEAYTSQQGSLEFIKEVSDLLIPFIIYDNDKYNDKTTAEMSTLILKNLVNDFRVLRGDYIGFCLTGGVDQRDLLTTYQAGRLVISSMDDLVESMIVDGNLIKTLYDNINNNSAHAKLTSDKEISASCLMYNLHGHFGQYIQEGELRNQLQTIFGKHITDFRNESMLPDDESDGVDNIHLIVSGLSLPVDRIKKTIVERDKDERTITSRKSTELDLSNVSKSKLSLRHKSFGRTSNNLVKNESDEVEIKTEPIVDEIKQEDIDNVGYFKNFKK